MKIAYFDTFSGVSGDMTIGAFLDLGMPLSALEEGLAPLGLEGVRLDVGHRVRSGIRATKFSVHTTEREEHAEGGSPLPGGRHHDHGHGHGHHHDDGDHHHHHAHDDGDHHHAHRSYRDIRELLARSALTPAVRERAEKIFHALAIAEARIHAMPVDDVGFHEVGAIDAIVDIVGASICFEHFGVERVYTSPLPMGSGMTRSQHGVIPVPAPATVEILRGFPTRFEDGTAELVTPTGAAILAALATPAIPPELVPEATGWGAGDREMPDRPNLLRVILAKSAPGTSRPVAVPPTDLEHDEMLVLEANVDDMNPELFEAATESLLAAGARDVSLAPLTMKNGRPATQIQVIGEPGARDALGRILLRETSTIGVRTYTVSRMMLPRQMRNVSTCYGAIAVKVVEVPGAGERCSPEYRDCHRAAREHGVPVATVFAETLKEAWKTGD